MDDLIGTLVYGNHKITRQLGAGGMGVVFEAVNTKLGKRTAAGQRLAIKVLRPETATNPQAVARFEQEALAASEIRQSPDSEQPHEHVARVIDVGQLPDGRQFIVMEFLEGKDLEQLLDDQVLGALAIDDAMSIIIQICCALDAAHRAGIVHRDLKPPNVFLVRHSAKIRYFVKLVDFGIAKLATPIRATNVMTHPGWVAGTPGYMAPEQLESPTSVDHRADIYAIGCIIYRIFARQMAFTGNLMSIALDQRNGVLPPSVVAVRPDVDPRLDQIIYKCLAFEPAARYQHIKALVEDLAALPGGREVCEQVWPLFFASPESRTVRSDGALPAPPPISPPPAVPTTTPATTHSGAVGAIERGTGLQPRRRSMWPTGVVAAVVTVSALVAVAVTRRGSSSEHTPAPAAASPGVAVPEPSPLPSVSPAARAAESTRSPAPTDEPSAEVATEPMKPAAAEIPAPVSKSRPADAARPKKRARGTRTPTPSPREAPPSAPTTEREPAKPTKPAFDPNGLVGQ